MRTNEHERMNKRMRPQVLATPKPKQQPRRRLHQKRQAQRSLLKVSSLALLYSYTINFIFRLDVEVTSLLRASLLQSISTTLSKLPPSSFPITATTFYSSHILPSRPFICASSSNATTTPIDIKNSSHKSLTTFLKSVEKEGLLKLKDQKSSAKPKTSELVITGVFPKHVDVVAHRKYTTVKDVEDKKAKKEEREEEERKKVKEMEVRECWKPWQGSLTFFEGAGAGGRCVGLHFVPVVILIFF
jgi:hypothetical protein